MQLITAEMYDFNRDTNGNPTSHFTLYKDGERLYETKRRHQCGYTDDRADAALVKARELISQSLTLASSAGQRSDGIIQATFKDQPL